MSNDRILIVDDEEAIREVVSSLLETKGYQCSTVGNGREAIEHLQANGFDLVLSDLVMPEMDGLQLLAWMQSNHPDIPIIMVTAMTTFPPPCKPYVTAPTTTFSNPLKRNSFS